MTTGTDTRIDVRLLRDADVERVEGGCPSIAMDAMDRTFGLAVSGARRSPASPGRNRLDPSHPRRPIPQGSVVAERDGEIVGCRAGCSPRDRSGFCRSWLYAVTFQGTGIGKAIARCDC